MKNGVIKRTLPNGVRILCETVPHVRSVALGIWVNTGSRMEEDGEAGVSHLIEHMLFKGTNRRTAEQIAQEIEGRGGHLNAFTDREVTCYYARILADDLAVGVDVLADMLTESKLDPADLSTEIGVVLEEIKKYEDVPEDHIHDLHAQHRWGDHPLGKPIIGTSDSVASFDQTALRNYMSKRYVAGKTLVVAAGRVDADELEKLVEERLGSLSGDFELPSGPKPVATTGTRELTKDVEQTHLCIGSDMVTISDDRRYAATVLDAVLGGGMSSRLFQEIREKRGLAYAVGSYTSYYREAGAFTVYAGTSPSTYEQVVELCLAELKRITEEPIPDDEMDRCKRMLCGSVVLSLESMSSRMHRMARNELFHGRDITIDETLERIAKVTPSDVRELAAEYLSPDNLTITAIGPF